jgi:hypothetical protein
MTGSEENDFSGIEASFGDTTPEARGAVEDIMLHEKLTRLIDKMDSENLGRAIVVRKPSEPRRPDPEQTDVARLASAIEATTGEPTSDFDTVGYVLPLEVDNTSHLLVFNNGIMGVIESASTTPDDAYERGYKDQYSPNAVPLGASSSYPRIHNVTEMSSALLTGGGGTRRIVAKNDSSETLPRFKEYIDAAVTTATEAKRNRDAARRESGQYLINQFEKTLFKRPPEPPQHGTPPPEAPPPTQQ